MSVDHHPLYHLLRHEGDPRTEVFLDLPTPYGVLRLDVLDMAKVLQTSSMSDEQLRDAEAKWQRGRALYVPGDHAASEQAMREIVRDYPSWGKGHGALFDLYSHLQDYPEAIYQLRQLIALQPTVPHLISLAEMFGRAGRLDDAAAIQGYLWERRGELRAEEARAAASDYLVTLGRQQRAAEMYEVATVMLATHGDDARTRYQQLLALILLERRAEALEGCKAALEGLSPEESIYPRFRQMLSMLGG